jgi:hypothetical protein
LPKPPKTPPPPDKRRLAGKAPREESDPVEKTRADTEDQRAKPPRKPRSIS